MMTGSTIASQYFFIPLLPEHVYIIMCGEIPGKRKILLQRSKSLSRVKESWRYFYWVTEISVLRNSQKLFIMENTFTQERLLRENGKFVKFKFFLCNFQPQTQIYKIHTTLYSTSKYAHMFSWQLCQSRPLEPCLSSVPKYGFRNFEVLI